MQVTQGDRPESALEVDNGVLCPLSLLRAYRSLTSKVALAIRHCRVLRRNRQDCSALYPRQRVATLNVRPSSVPQATPVSIICTPRCQKRQRRRGARHSSTYKLSRAKTPLRNDEPNRWQIFVPRAWLTVATIRMHVKSSEPMTVEDVSRPSRYRAGSRTLSFVLVQPMPCMRCYAERAG